VKDEEIKKLDLSNWPLPDEYLLEIGRATRLWHALEASVNTCLCKLAGFEKTLDERAFILIVHSTFPQRLSNLASLCELLKKDFPHLADYKPVIALIKRAQDLRNNFTHNTIVYLEETKQVRMSKGSAREALKFESKIISLEEIKRASITINEALRALYKLVLRRDIPPPWEIKSSSRRH
jgi:hypothetical protein